MSKRYNNYEPEYKLKVAIEALRNMSTVSEIASKYKIHSARVSEWKKHLLENGPEIFKSKSHNKRSIAIGEDVDFLQQQIGKLTIELEWLKKKHGITT